MTRIKHTMRLVIPLSTVLAAAPLWGCGRYGPPVRPQQSVPAEPALEKPAATLPAENAPEAANAPEIPQDDEEEDSQ
jgi:hypothetical protein